MIQPTSYYLADRRASEHTTALFLDGAISGLLIALLSISSLLMLLHRRRARAANAADRAQTLAPGPTVIVGTVAEDDEKTPAITVDIEQKGREWVYKSAWQHEWKEIRRTVTARPFYVTTADRAQVRVEPNQRVLLVDALDRVKSESEDRRHRFAKLTVGESVHILGTLVRDADPRQGGYREAGIGWVLRPPKTGRMVISTEPLGERFEERERVYRRFALGTLLLLLLVHAGVYFSFNLLRLTGHEVIATVRSTDTYDRYHRVKYGQGYWEHYYRVRAEWNSRQLADHCSMKLYYDLQAPGASKEVPFVVSSLLPAIHMIGHEPSFPDWNMGVLLLVVMITGVSWVSVIARTRPWYDRRRVIDSGSGTLFSSAKKTS